MEMDQTETNNLIEEFPDIAIELSADWQNWIKNRER